MCHYAVCHLPKNFFHLCFVFIFTSSNETARFFAFSLIIEGTTEKVLQFIMPLKSICNQNLGFIEQIMYFEHYREVQTRTNLLIVIIFVMKIFF
jgi:hypothetical protein